MNERFFLLDEKRQEQILNAGYKGFAQNTYAKTSMSMVAEEAGISKSLLFHYFVNKKEFYLYLYERALAQVKETLPEKNNVEERELFEVLKEHMQKKWELLKENPFLFQFMNRSYYETDETLQKELHDIMNQYMTAPISQLMQCAKHMGKRQDKDEIIHVLLYMAEGFAFANNEKIQKNPVEAMKEFERLLDYVKKLYDEE
ncbi:TetR/AcrR family transcriptional regulator [Roseburia sp. 499]|uniref:TetR/AcrR family transcriptional regulator n=1 Tax=Roseburia sp. 499 TaxID=1261634 RepID=UPI0009515CB9|nr:TetR/AcrR family transcriptional regulator [Roseburia sp. 499]WVK71032.1 TetR/AcrR family transcriptional regulator [Roseburia sp. 499]